jgi:hypothetical protein
MTCSFSKGDRVKYFSIIGQSCEPTYHTVLAVYRAGIESCREPMLSLTNKAGLVLASHCILMIPADAQQVGGKGK